MEQKSMNSFLFIMLIQQYESSAYQFMGKFANPIDGKVERNLEAAKTFIDILRMLKEKTEGNRTPEESKVIETTLTNLQLNFMDEAKKGPTTAGKEDEIPTAEKEDVFPEKTELLKEEEIKEQISVKEKKPKFKSKDDLDHFTDEDIDDKSLKKKKIKKKKQEKEEF